MHHTALGQPVGEAKSVEAGAEYFGLPATGFSDPASRVQEQGQYLAFIHNYMERYFQVTPPAIHDMIKTLELNGLIERTPGQARSIRLLVQPQHLPRLE